jgi:hypothetical protein
VRLIGVTITIFAGQTFRTDLLDANRAIARASLPTEQRRASLATAGDVQGSAVGRLE